MYVTRSAPTTTTSVDAVGSSPRARRDEPASPAPTGGDAASASVSGPAQLMGKLSQLRDADPDQFSRVVSGMASDLRSVAARDTGMSSKMLTALASKLDDIASGGAIGPLESPAPAPGAAAPALAPDASPAPQREAPPSVPPAPPRPPESAGDGAPRAAVPRTAAAQAYRAQAAAEPGDADGARAAIAKVLDDLDAVLKTTTSVKA